MPVSAEVPAWDEPLAWDELLDGRPQQTGAPDEPAPRRPRRAEAKPGLRRR